MTCSPPVLRALLVGSLFASQIACGPYVPDYCGDQEPDTAGLADLLNSLAVVPVGATLPLSVKTGEVVTARLVRSDGSDIANLRLGDGTPVTISIQWIVIRDQGVANRDLHYSTASTGTEPEFQVALLGPLVQKATAASTETLPFRIMAVVTVETDVLAAPVDSPPLSLPPSPLSPGLSPGLSLPPVTPPPPDGKVRITACAQIGFDLQVAALEVPSILALFRHVNFEAINEYSTLCQRNKLGAALIFASDSYRIELSELTAMPAPGANRDSLATSVDRLTTLTSVPGIGQYAAAVTLLRQVLLRQQDVDDGVVHFTGPSESELGNFVLIQNSLPCNDIEAEDAFSSLIFLGVRNSKAEMWIDDGYRGCYLLAATDDAMSVVATYLHNIMPGSIPPGRFTTNSACNNDWGDKISSAKVYNPGQR
jgi:hypothetical protein